MEGGHQSSQNVYSVNIWLVGVTPPVFALFITKHKFKLYIKHIDPAPFTPIWEYLGLFTHAYLVAMTIQIFQNKIELGAFFSKKHFFSLGRNRECYPSDSKVQTVILW